MQKVGMIKTYGRHRQRVIVAEDNWLTDGDKRLQRVFSSSSDSSKNSSVQNSSDGSDIYGLSLNSTGNSILGTKKHTRKAQLKDDKENKVVGRRKGQAKTSRTHKEKVHDSVSSDTSPASLHKERSQRTRALRDRGNQIDYNDTAQFKKQLNGAANKRKRHPRTCTQKDKSEVINFSDFDNYSLVISDSPLCAGTNQTQKDHIDTSTPVSDRTQNQQHGLDRETNTPVSKRTRNNCQNSMKETCVEMPSPVSDVFTPESIPSCSMYQTPSENFSHFSNEGCSSYSSYVSTTSNKQDGGILDQLREIQNLTRNMRNSSLTRTNKPMLLRSSRANVSHDLSASLFSSPDLPIKNPVFLVNKQDPQCFSSDLDDTESDDDDSENDDENDEDSKELSAIEEVSNHDESESDDDNDEKTDSEEETENSDDSDDGEIETDATNSELDTSENGEINHGRTNAESDVESHDSPQMQPAVSLQRLSESFLMNHVIDRRPKRKTRRKQLNNVDEMDAVDDEIEAIVNQLEKSHLDVATDDGAKSSGESSTESQGDVQTSKRYSLRGQLPHSFTEMLTPKRKKNNLIPVSARTRALILCDQTEPITFSKAMSARMLSQCKKIGEGVYGEVFKTTNASKQSVAIKIIPIEGDFTVNDEPQKKFEEILPEIVIAKELSSLRELETCTTSSYCEVLGVSCVYGRYPPSLIKQWDIYNTNKQSENDRPDMFPEKQLYIMFEFEDCGSALEGYKFDSYSHGKSVLSQVAFALAVAEEELKFEHRDLHWGNVLISETNSDDISYKLMGESFKIPTLGLKTSVIDFTMSRLTKDGCTVYTNLANDDTLFEGKGDYQFDIYREMKKCNNNNWEKFTPRTNVLWLHYLADKLLYSCDYTSKTSRADREMLRQFRQFLSTMLNYNSATEMVIDSAWLKS